MANLLRVRVAGLNESELKSAVDSIKKEGAQIVIDSHVAGAATGASSFPANPDAKRFAPSSPEFSLQADERAIAKLLVRKGVMMASCSTPTHGG